jgi:hypothetical protein
LLLISLMLLTQMPAENPVGHCATAISQRMHGSEVRPIKRIGRKPVPKLGEKRAFWLENLSVMPPGQRQLEATCHGVGNHCYLFVEDSSWNAGQMDSTDIEFILKRFDHQSPRDSTKGVWQLNTGSFGMPPDVDNDSLIYIMFYDIGSFHGYTFDGFWSFFDEYPDSIAYPQWGYHSNECEIVYLDDYPARPNTDYRVAIVAHEFAHMIHYNYDQAESLWVNEGCAELAMWLYGSPDPISGFNSNPNDDLVIWDGQWTDYIQTYLFFLYLYEQYGERVGTPLIKQIVANPLQSIEGIDSTFAELGLAQRFTGSFNDWVIANFMDDTLVYGGRYGYFGERLPVFTYTSHSTYPVNQSSSVNRWAAKYARFSRGQSLTLGFDGNDAGQFKAQVIERDTISRTFVVDSITLDPSQAGSITIPDFGTTYQFVYLVPTNNIANGGPTSYSYTANVAAGIGDAGMGRVETPGLDIHPARNRLLISYAAQQKGIVEFGLYNVSGACVQQTSLPAQTGLTLTQFDVTDVPAGTYFLTAGQGGHRSTAKVAIVR